MLLHEILKYPSLELVVGLEIDQKVTRGSFKHFGTQPHWDNDKVEWWYGDASKSLLMLPKEYFGTFDMVLVDLSETITSSLVTEGLDIMGALGLLLQPEGILVKNELYLEKMSSIFNHTVQVNFGDIPVICSQALSLGSPGLDFLKRAPKDHGVDTIVLKPLEKNADRFDIWHDYRQNENNSFKQHCIPPDEAEKEPEEQTRSPGILMILEAENVSGAVTPSKKVRGTLEKALKKQGLKVVSSVLSPSDAKGAAVVVIFKEGYVVARTWPEHKYCAFDILLWSSFEKIENIKAALISAIGGSGGTSSSSYRIVTGGMFGVSTWKDDEKKRGPRFGVCQDTESSARDTPPDSSAVATVLSESISLIQTDNPTVAAVVCGEDTQKCGSLDVLAKHEKVKKTVILKACPGIDGNNSKMFDCELEVWKTIRDAVENGEKLGAIVLDPSASYTMAQITLKIFDNHAKRMEALSDDAVIVATTLDETESWRRNFLDRFRMDIFIYEPVFRAEVLFNSTDSSLEMGVTLSRDPLFFQHLVDAVTRIEKQTGLDSDVRNIENGLWPYMADFTPSQFVLPGDYDQTSPLQQWRSQKPLGHQTVFQYELRPIVNYVQGDKVKANYEGQGEFFPGIITSVNSDGTYDIRYDDGDFESSVERGVIKGLEEKRTVEPTPLSTASIKDALQQTLTTMEGMDDAVLKEFTNVGDGCVLVAMGSGGSAVVVWDGRVHVDVNLFTHVESKIVADSFSRTLRGQLSFLQLLLRDEQPRGFGRVVNFQQDIKAGVDPVWAGTTSTA